jgi:hypothetical protein
VDEYLKLLTYLAGPAIVSMVGAIVTLWRELSRHKLHVAENYLKKTDIEQLQTDVRETRDIVHQIAGKLGVPTRPF